MKDMVGTLLNNPKNLVATTPPYTLLTCNKYLRQQENMAKWLSETPLFSGISQGELAPFVGAAQTRLYKQKMYIFMEGDQLDRIFFIRTGKVKIYKTDFTGKEYIISILEPGDMFPYAGFFKQDHYIAYAEVLEDANLIVIPIKSFEAILISNPKLCMKLFKFLGERIDDLEGRLEAQILHCTYNQIILLLIRLCQSNGEKTEKGYRLKTKFTNRDLANMIGTSRESVSRTLKQLKKNNYIFENKDGFYHIDKDSLKQRLV